MVKKCYKIEFIVDSRFGGTKRKLITMDKKLMKSNIGVIGATPIRALTFENGKTKQWRRGYIISRGNQTWREVMTKVNKIQAPFYKRVNC